MTPPSKSPRSDRKPYSPRFPIIATNRKIGIAVDLSEESAYAVRWAVRNYLRSGDKVFLLHVQPTSVLYGADWGASDLLPLRDPENEESRRKMEDDFDLFTDETANDIAKPLVRAKIPFNIYIFKDHDMKERLCLEVKRLGLRTLIMGSRGYEAYKRSNFERLGRVSDYFLQHCACVVVVRYPDEMDREDAKFNEIIAKIMGDSYKRRTLYEMGEEDYHDV